MAVTTEPKRGRAGAVAYWTATVALLAFGFLGLFSVGMPFLLLGLTLAVLGSMRHRRRIIWPAVTAVVLLSAGYVLLAPLGCTASSLSHPYGFTPTGHTVCTNLLGIDYSGSGNYQPSLIPALLGGVALAILGGVAVALAIRKWERSSPG